MIRSTFSLMRSYSHAPWFFLNCSLYIARGINNNKKVYGILPTWYLWYNWPRKPYIKPPWYEYSYGAIEFASKWRRRYFCKNTLNSILEFYIWCVRYEVVNDITCGLSYWEEEFMRISLYSVMNGRGISNKLYVWRSYCISCITHVLLSIVPIHIFTW